MAKKVVIADDSYAMRASITRLVQRYCRKKGLEVHVDQVENGDELVKVLLNEPHDLVITDNNMPLCTGLQAIRRIREFNPNVPICMLSAGPEKVRRYAREAGANYYIDKPDFYRQHEEMLNRYLAKDQEYY